MTDKEEILSAMYAQEEEAEEGPREQPIQLRLAGKATIVPIGDQQLAVPKIEYIEALERQVRQQTEVITALQARMKKLELMMSKNANIANRRLNDVELGVSSLKGRREY